MIGTLKGSALGALLCRKPVDLLPLQPRLAVAPGSRLPWRRLRGKNHPLPPLPKKASRKRSVSEFAGMILMPRLKQSLLV